MSTRDAVAGSDVAIRSLTVKTSACLFPGWQNGCRLSRLLQWQSPKSRRDLQICQNLQPAYERLIPTASPVFICCCRFVLGTAGSAWHFAISHLSEGEKDYCGFYAGLGINRTRLSFESLRSCTDHLEDGREQVRL